MSNQMKKSEELFGVDGDVLALEILLDPTLTTEERDRKLAQVLRQFTTTVERKVRK